MPDPKLSERQWGLLLLVITKRRYWDRRQLRQRGFRVNTAESLVALGLLEPRYCIVFTEYKATPAGRALAEKRLAEQEETE